MGEELVNPEDRRKTRRSRRQSTGNSPEVHWSLIGIGALVFYLLARDWTLAGLGPAELGVLPCLALLCVWPVIHWQRSGMKWLPTGEAFAAMSLVYYVFPCLAGNPDWLQLPSSQRCLALLGVGVFLASFLITYRFILPGNRPSPSAGLLRREVSPNFIWGMFWLWLAFNVVLRIHLVRNLGPLLNVLNSAVIAVGSIAIVYLCFKMGRDQLPPQSRALVIMGLAIGLAFNFSSGFLNGGAAIMGLALLGNTLGRRQLPVVATLFCVGALVILQMGKDEFRYKYWSEGQNSSNQRIGLVEGYSTWLDGAWRALTHKNAESIEKQNLLERTSLIQALAQAMILTPAEKPFLAGQTYEMLPELLVPRIFWPEKPRGTLPTETVGIYIEIQSEQNADVTGISVGPVVEAWVNFGWIGLVVAGAFLGALFGIPARLSSSLTPVHVGWLLASIFLVYSIDLEHSIPEMLCSLLQALLMGAALLLSVSTGEKVHRAAALPKKAARTWKVRREETES